ncbi:MAG TPA: lytic transglycosylase domain-containing protein [Steroidobacteraceae bacterium]|nr:lytic transglycosylase domain-containing protein [Steroidobacteraceae bacterium]
MMRHARLQVILTLLGLAAAGAEAGQAQRDPGLRAVIAAAISGKSCFEGKYDDVVWYALMQPRVEKRLRQQPADLRLGDDVTAAAQRILRAVHCESNKHNMLRDRPQLVLAVIDVESAFDPFAVSSAGAVGLMQVMPFWPNELGLSTRDLIDVELNVRMGTSILAYYLDRERGDYHRALGRYNGSLGKRTYPDLVLGRLHSRWQR